MQGRESNFCLANLIGRLAADDAALVKVLRRQGAVIYVRTNMPTATLDCNSEYPYAVWVQRDGPMKLIRAQGVRCDVEPAQP